MKVYFVGAHSVGKTTLARYVSDKYKIPLLPEVARQILAERELNLNSLRTNLEVVNDYQTRILYRQIEQECKIDNFVSDRSFDCLAYAAQHSQILHILLKDSWTLSYIDKLKEPDNFIFFIRPSKATLKDDGIREILTWDGIVAIDAQVKFLCEMFELKYFQINTDNMQERARLVDSILSLRAY